MIPEGRSRVPSLPVHAENHVSVVAEGVDEHPSVLVFKNQATEMLSIRVDLERKKEKRVDREMYHWLMVKWPELAQGGALAKRGIVEVLKFCPEWTETVRLYPSHPGSVIIEEKGKIEIAQDQAITATDAFLLEPGL
jgi:hypothetical protein